MTPADDAAIPLRDIPALFPELRFTLSTLRAEAGRGRLRVFRVGRRDYTTPADVRKMRYSMFQFRHSLSGIGISITVPYITPANCRAFGKGRTDAAARHTPRSIHRRGRRTDFAFVNDG